MRKQLTATQGLWGSYENSQDDTRGIICNACPPTHDVLLEVGTSFLCSFSVESGNAVC